MLDVDVGSPNTMSLPRYKLLNLFEVLPKSTSSVELGIIFVLPVWYTFAAVTLEPPIKSELAVSAQYATFANGTAVSEYACLKLRPFLIVKPIPSLSLNSAVKSLVLTPSMSVFCNDVLLNVNE